MPDQMQGPKSKEELRILYTEIQSMLQKEQYWEGERRKDSIDWHGSRRFLMQISSSLVVQ